MIDVNDYQRQKLVGFLWFGLAFAILAYLLSGCGNAYVTAYKSLATVRATAELTEQTLSDVCRIKAENCQAAHTSDASAFGECVGPCVDALGNWITYVRPAVNTGLAAGLGAIEVARAAKSKPDVLAIMKPIACALARGMKAWGHLLPPKVKTQVESIVKLVDAATCKGG